MGKLADYDAFVSSHTILGFFKDLRDIDVHEANIGKQTTISAEVTLLSPDSNIQKQKPDLVPNTKPARITISLTRKLEINDELINELKSKQRYDLLEALSNAKDLHRELSHEGQNDVFQLLPQYMDGIESFIKYGIEKRFIS